MNEWNYFAGGASTPSSCKYAVLPEKCIGSPQDLSLTTTSHLTAAQNSLAGAVSSASVTATANGPSASSASSNKHLHDMSSKSSKSSQHRNHSSSSHHTGHHGGKNSSTASAVAAAAAAALAVSSPSSVSSMSSGSSEPNSPGDPDGGKNPNAPQIYPWMKRVHLGQSKCINKSLIVQ